MTVWTSRAIIRRPENGIPAIAGRFARQPTAEPAALAEPLRQALAALVRDNREQLPFRQDPSAGR
jgi:hypothetical protein